MGCWHSFRHRSSVSGRYHALISFERRSPVRLVDIILQGEITAPHIRGRMISLQQVRIPNLIVPIPPLIFNFYAFFAAIVVNHLGNVSWPIP
jgi:hypothetical protein